MIKFFVSVNNFKFKIFTNEHNLVINYRLILRYQSDLKIPQMFVETFKNKK